MPQSRRDKSRKNKVTNYKNQKKKSMSQNPEMKPFRQIPTWDSKDSFEIQGSELEALYNYFNIVAPAFTSIQQVFSRGIQSGKIKIGYEYEDGSGAVSDAEVKAYTEKLQEYFKQKMSKEGVSEDVADEILADEPSTEGKIVGLYGEKLSTETV